MAAPEELTAYLESQSLGTIGTDIFRHQMPATPDVATCVRQLGGNGSVLASGREVAERINVRFECRATSRDAAETQCYLVRDAVQRLANIDLSGVRYYSVFVARAPGPLIVDATALRFTYYFEVRVLKAPS